MRSAGRKHRAPLVRGHSVDGDMDALERVGAADRPVAAGRETSPGAQERPERVLPRGSFGSEEGDGQLVQLWFVRGPQRLDVGRGTEAREPGYVVGVHELEMGQVRTRVARPVRLPRRLHGVQRVAYGPVAQRVEMALEAERVQLGHVRRKLGRVDEAGAPIGGGAAALVEIGVEQRGRTRLGDPVQHELDARGAEPAVAQRGPSLDEFGNLLGPTLAVPPQSADDPRGQRTLAGRRQIGLGRIVHPEELPDQRVLPGGDAERVQMPLGMQQGGEPIRRGGRRREPADVLHSPFLKHPDGLARRVPFEPAVCRIGRVPCDTGEFQRAAVDPGAVVVAVGQIHRPVRYDRVQQRLRRRTALEGLHGPAAAGDPLSVGVRVGVRPNDGKRVPGRLRPGQVALGELQARRHRVDVRVLEPGQEQPSGEIDHFGPRADQFVYLGVPELTEPGNARPSQ
jgi:hypothetical protein